MPTRVHPETVPDKMMRTQQTLPWLLMMTKARNRAMMGTKRDRTVSPVV